MMPNANWALDYHAAKPQQMISCRRPERRAINLVSWLRAHKQHCHESQRPCQLKSSALSRGHESCQDWQVLETELSEMSGLYACM